MENVELLTTSSCSAGCKVLSFDPRFLRVGDGLYHSVDGRGHLRFHSTHRLTLRLHADSAASVLISGLSMQGRVYLRRADGLLLQADQLGAPDLGRLGWRHLRPVEVDPSSMAPWDAVLVSHSPNTSTFSSPDGRLRGRFNQESGRLSAAEGAQAFDGLAGRGAVVLCFEGGCGGIFPVTREPCGRFRLDGLSPYLVEDRVTV